MKKWNHLKLAIFIITDEIGTLDVVWRTMIQYSKCDCNDQHIYFEMVSVHS